MNRFHEFFEVKGCLSMRNLSIFITIVASSLVVVYMALKGTLGSEMFATYLLAGGGVYSFGKWQDEKTNRSAE